MATKTVLFLAILLTAIAMAAGLAHVFELPGKMRLSREDYLTVQQIYRGWALLGIAVVGALAMTIVLAYLARGDGTLFGLALAAAACIAASLVIFFVFTQPANVATANWTQLPAADWLALRRRWEFSHAASAALYVAALVMLTIGALSERR